MKVIDADGLVLGRLASVLAKRLLRGEEIAVVNAEKAIILGDPEEVITRYRRKKALNHPRKGPFFPRMPDRMLKRTIRGMIPYQKHSGRQAYKRLKVYIGVPDELKDRRFRTVNEARKPPSMNYITLGEVSKALGAHFGSDYR